MLLGMWFRKHCVINEEEVQQGLHFPTQSLTVCPSRIVKRNVFETTCLGALYRNLTSVVSALCTFEYSRTAKTIQKINEQKLVVISSEDGELFCPGSTTPTRFPFRTAGPQIVTVEKDCKLIVGDEEFSVLRDIQEEIAIDTFTRIDLNFHVDNFTVDRHNAISEMVGKFQTVSNIELDFRDREAAIDSSQNTTLWTLFAVVLTLSIVGIGLYVCGCCSRLRKNRMQNYPLS